MNEIVTKNHTPRNSKQLAKWACLLVAAAGLVSCATPAGKTDSAQRSDVRQMTKQTLNRLYAAKPQARTQIANSVGYAVFNRVDTKIMAVGSANGYGLAVNRQNGQETYLRMAGLSAGFGAGLKNSRAVMIFRSPAKFKQLVTSGWSAGADAGAGAAYDNSGAGAAVKITPTTDPIIYQMTDTGVELSATLGAEKVWPDKDLNP